MNHSYSKRDCICGDYKPYQPKGITAMIRPLNACINCHREAESRKMKGKLDGFKEPNDFKSTWLPG